MTSPERSEKISMTHGDTMSTVIGVGFMTFFGAIWWLMAAGSAGDGQAAMWVAGAVIVGVLLWRVVRLWQSARGRDGERSDDWEERNRTFSRIGAIEGIAIAAGAVVCGIGGHAEWIPTWCAFVVGAHFLPLARLFEVPVYRTTGLTMMTLAVAGAVIIPAAGQPRAAWFVVPGCFSALSLWATAVVILKSSTTEAHAV